MAKEYKSILQDLYGNELAELILFGSYARDDQQNESDVDFAIVLYNPDTRPAAEIIKTSAIASRLSLKYGLMVSSLSVSLHKNKLPCRECTGKFVKKELQYDFSCI